MGNLALVGRIVTFISVGVLMLVIGGGIVAGSIGMLSFYAALRGAGSLSQVMPIAFTVISTSVMLA